MIFLCFLYLARFFILTLFKKINIYIYIIHRFGGKHKLISYRRYGRFKDKTKTNIAYWGKSIIYEIRIRLIIR